MNQVDMLNLAAQYGKQAFIQGKQPLAQQDDKLVTLVGNYTGDKWSVVKAWHGGYNSEWEKTNGSR